MPCGRSRAGNSGSPPAPRRRNSSGHTDGLLGPHLLSQAAAEHLLQAHYTTIIWNSVPGDWKDQDGWVDRCLDQIRAQDWSMTVLHDI